MTTPPVPELPELCGQAKAAPAAAGAVLLLLVLTLVLPVLVGAVPAGPLATVALLLLVSVAALAVGIGEDGGPSPVAAPGPGAPPCGLEDVTDTLRCDRPSGHSGAHVDGRRVQEFGDTLAAHIGDAGAYCRDRRGRPVPIEDAF